MNSEDLKRAVEQVRAMGWNPAFILGTHDLPRGTSAMAYNAEDLERVVNKFVVVERDEPLRGCRDGAIHGMTVIFLPKERRHGNVLTKEVRLVLREKAIEIINHIDECEDSDKINALMRKLEDVYESLERKG